MKETKSQTVQRAKNRGVDILRYEEVEELGASKSHAEVVSCFYSDWDTFFRFRTAAPKP